MENDKMICLNCGGIKEEYESAYCDKCWQKEEKRLKGQKKLIIKNESDNKKTELDFDNLDFGLGDYFYNGTYSGGQIGFCWQEELGIEYVDYLYLNLYVGNEEENDLCMLDFTLKNLSVDKKLQITLSNMDYEVFVSWYDKVNRKDFHYYNNEEIKELNIAKNNFIITLDKSLLNDKDMDFFHYDYGYELAICEYGIIRIDSLGELKCTYIIDKDKGEYTNNYCDIVNYYVRDNEEYEKAINEKLFCDLNNWFSIEVFDNEGNYIEGFFSDSVYGSISEAYYEFLEFIKEENIVKEIKEEMKND